VIARRTATSPRSSAIIAVASASAAWLARGRQRRAVGVADGHRERVGGVIGARLLGQAEQRLTMRAT
jgi:hypothetical protein